MGWANGVDLFDDIVREIELYQIDVEIKRRIISKMVDLFEEMDCHTLYESEFNRPGCTTHSVFMQKGIVDEEY